MKHIFIQSVKRSRLWRWWFIVSLALPSICFAETNNIRFEKIQIDQHLSTNIRSIFQDSQGYIWIGSEEGVSRFDGHEHKIYSLHHMQRGTLIDGLVYSIAEDKHQNIWLGTHTGISVLDPVSEAFEHYQYTNTEEFSLPSGQVRVIFKDSQDQIWTGTDSGLSKFDEATKHFIQYGLKQDTQIKYIRDIVEDKQGTLWIATDGQGLFGFSSKSETFDLISSEDKALQASIGSRVGALAVDNTGTLLVGTYGKGIVQLDTRTHKRIPTPDNADTEASISALNVRDIHQDKRGDIWLSSNTGLYLWQAGSQGFQKLSNISESGKLARSKVYDVFEDNTGIMWLGGGLGLYKWQPDTNNFAHYRYIANSSAGLSHNSANAIHQTSESDIWVGTVDGLNRLNIETGEIRHYLYSETDNNSLIDNRVMALYGVSPDELWIGTRISGLNMLNPLTGKFTHYVHEPNNPNSLSANAIPAITAGKSGKLWVATFGGGLNLFDPLTETFTRFQHRPEDPNSLSSDRIISIMQDRQGMLWLGTLNKGVNLFDPVSKSVVHIRHQPNIPNSLMSNYVYVVREDSAGNIWVGNAKGLNFLSAANRMANSYEFEHITRRDGLPSDNIYGILEDKNGMLWLSSSQGLTRYNPVSKEMKNYRKSHGLQGDDFNSGSYYKAKNGQLFFGGVNGLTAFFPKDIKSNTHVPPIVLSEFLIRNEPVPIAHVMRDGGPIIVGYQDYSLAFKFAALDYASPKDNQYRYKLEGFEDEWVNADKVRRANYTNLPAGEYVFKVKGSNNDGLWNEEGLSVPLTVLPPPWLTWWAYTLYALVLMIALYSLYIYRTRQLRRQNVLLEQTVADRTSDLHSSNQHISQLLAQKQYLFANVSHEFRTPLSLIIGPLDKILGRIDDSDLQKQVGLINRNARRLARLVDQVLDLAKLETARNIPLKTYPIQRSVKVIAESFETLVELRSQKLDVQIECSGTLALLDDSFEKILSNLISNAIKYTPIGGHIVVRATQEEDSLILSVTDNGPGINEQMQDKVFERFLRLEGSEEVSGSGIGLALAKELVEANNGSISVRSQVGEGSCFSVSLPMTQQDEQNIPTPKISLISMQHDEVKLGAPIIVEELDDNDTVLETILVVEDNRDMCSFIVDSLQSRYRCITASNGLQGISLATEKLPDLIISDLMMPGKTGLELAATIREQTLTSHIPIVLLTAKGDEQSRIAGWKMDVDDYIAKPFNMAELEARVARLLSIRQILQKRQGRIANDAIEHASHDQSNFDNEKDQAFYQAFVGVIEANYHNEGFSRGDMAQHLALSERQLNRKLKALIDVNFSEFLRKYRLEQAKQRLIQGEQITQVSYEVGFASSAYFSSCFKAEYTMTPTQFVDKNGK